MFINIIILFNCVMIYVICDVPFVTVHNESFLISNTNYTFKKNLVQYFENYFHFLITRQFYRKRENWRTSNLGTILFKRTGKTWRFNTMKRKKKKFVVYIWNRDNILATGADLDPHNLAVFTLEGCRVNNCFFTRQHRYLNTADVILVNVNKGEVPEVGKRNTTQKWVLLSTESPVNMFKVSLTGKSKKLSDLANKFNWTMTYRSDADVPLPYGRVIPLSSPVIVPFNNVNKALLELVPHWKIKRHDVLLTMLMTNQDANHQMHFVKRLMKYMFVDIYGTYSTVEHFKKLCPYNINKDCPALAQYLFYLVIENSRCEHYVTEKVFYNAFAKGAIPVILWGTPLKDCEDLLPPHSYLHIDNYKSYKHLVAHMLQISESKMELLTYHTWRRHFKAVNEHGYFGTKSVHFCRLCEALNYNNYERKVYSYNHLKDMFGRIKCKT